MTEDYTYRFSGIARLYGQESLKKLQSSRILVVGLGGVGSWVVESLARSGVGTIGLVDFDDICISNTNRQLHALEGEIGKQKTESLKARSLKINPEVDILSFNLPYSLETEESIFAETYDVVIDCIDHAHTKLFLAKACLKRKIPQVVVGSAGGRRDPQLIKACDLSKTREDNLLAMLRKDLRRQCGLPRKGKMGIQAIYSQEKPLYPLGEDKFTRLKPDDFKKPLDCSTGFGTVTHITGTFAFLAAHVAIQNRLSQPFLESESK